MTLIEKLVSTFTQRFEKKIAAHAPGGLNVSHAGRSELIVAILTYNNFDDWLEEIGVSVESFSQEMMGAWQFNYIQAFQYAGIRSLYFCTSNKVEKPTRVIHKPTGTTICVLPSSKAYRFILKWRKRVIRTADTSVGVAYANRVMRGALGLAASYLSTPLVSLRRELRREGCQCILVEQYEDPRFDLTVFLGQLICMPVFGTFALVVPTQNWWKRPFRHFALRLSSGLVICQEREAKRVREFYGVPERKLARIYYPVDRSVWYPSPQRDARASLGIPTDAKVVVFHGRIELWTKGLDILVNAWDQLCRDQPSRDLRLILIGTGSDDQKLAQLLAVRQLRGVKWLNQWVHDRNVLRRYLSAADVYVFPSRIDAFGIAVIEAMACGLPIVAAAAPGILDILVDGEQSGGLVVPTGDAIALASAINRILSDAKLACELAKCARCRVETMCSMETIGYQLRKFLFSHQYSA